MLESDSSLFEPLHFRERLAALDSLDAHFGASGFAGFPGSTDSADLRRASEMQAQLESINTRLYRSIRSEIRRGTRPPSPLLSLLSSNGREKTLRPYGAYDDRDELLSGILNLREPGEASHYPAPETVFYQPTPVRHILGMLAACKLSPDDLFVDIGSGLGHVLLLMSILTGVQCLGIEVEHTYVESARQCARNLRLSRIRFLTRDVRKTDLSRGTVFYLYSPFSGSILAQVLDRLRRQSLTRPIRICTLGPCTTPVSREHWLSSTTPPDPDRITVFHSRTSPSIDHGSKI